MTIALAGTGVYLYALHATGGLGGEVLVATDDHTVALLLAGAPRLAPMPVIPSSVWIR